MAATAGSTAPDWEVDMDGLSFHRRMILLLPFCVFWCLLVHAAHGGTPSGSATIGPRAILEDFAEAYRRKAPDSLSLVVQFDIPPGGESWRVEVEPGPEVTVARGPDERAAFVFSIDLGTLRRIHAGKMTAMTAGGKASGADAAPLEMEPTEAAASIPDVRAVVLSFLQHFFNPSSPERILLGESYSRIVHGAHVIPLYYAPAFRSAWYMVRKGQRLNEPGDTNPFPQAFVILSGEGHATIGPDTVEVRGGESYYIPPGSDHVLWTDRDEPVVLIWMGWGEGA